VYNDQRVTADRILVVGPSDKFLRFVATVLPTLGEARIMQTTFDRLLGPSTEVGSDERWIDVLDALELSLLRPREVKLGYAIIVEDEVRELIDRLRSRPLPWQDRRKIFIEALMSRVAERRPDISRPETAKAIADVWPSCTARQAWAKVRSRAVLVELGAPDDLIGAWMATSREDGALFDEVRARFQGVPARYSHVIVDEAQDLSFFQLRAVLRRAEGLTLVGDDAQRSNPTGIGLRRAAVELETELATMDTAYRMSAEIADWLNAHAIEAGIDAVMLVGIRPTGRPVQRISVTSAVEIESIASALGETWPNVATIRAGEVWEHKGVEYDAVVVDTTGLTPDELYLAASRAAHELVLVDGAG